MVLYISLFLCVVGGLQGLFLASILVKLAKKRTGNYRWLIALLILVSTTLIARILFLYEEAIDIRLAIFSDLVLFVYGPLFFFFIKTAFDESPKRNIWIHFVPAGIHIVSVVPQLLISYESYFLFTTTTGWMVYVFSLMYLALAHNILYWVKSRGVLKRTLYNLKNKSLSNKTSYIRVSHRLYGVVLILFTAAMLVIPFQYIIAVNIYQISWIVASWFTFIITYQLILNPARFGDHYIRLKHQVEKSDSEKSLLENLALKLHSELNESKIYLDPEISLSTLSKRLKTNQVLLSKAINQKFNCTFYNLINRYRTEEFIKLVESNEYDHLNYFGLAVESGFNSKTSFNKYFKIHTGVTPTEYFKKRKTPLVLRSE